MSSQTSEKTTDHDTIRSWAETRGGKPATVGETTTRGDAGVLTIMFPESEHAADHSELLEISWDEWFEKFDSENLALLYQETTADGNKSMFNKIVER